MSPQSEFPAIFQKLKAVLQPYAATLTLQHDTPGLYSLEGPYSEKWGKPLFFGSAQIRKNYVSFYLMPVYMFPGLLDGISPELKKHMQGKSCFNFRKLEPVLFEELAGLTRRAAERFRREFSAR